MKLSALALSCALALVAHAASAQTSTQRFPVKPVRIVVPYAAGGPLDDIARYLGNKLTPRWGQPVLVDTRGGSGGAVGTEIVTKSPPDGYTLLLGNGGPITVYPHLRKKPLYDPEKNLEPVTWLLTSPMVLLVHPSTPVKSVRDLVRVARQKPGGLTYGSAGVGNLQHLSMELLQRTAGLKMVHVPYKGAAPAFVDLVAGQVDVMFANIFGAMPQVRSGRLRAIGVSSAKVPAAAAALDIPPVAATYPGFDVTGWMGIFAPAGTPKELVNAIHADFAAVLAMPETKQRLADGGGEPVGAGPAELSAFLKKESAMFARIIKEAGIPQE